MENEEDEKNGNLGKKEDADAENKEGKGEEREMGELEC